MTTKELKKYRLICAEIEHIDKRLTGALQHVRDSVQSAAKHPYNVHSVSVEGNIYSRSSPTLLARKSELLAKKREIETFIENIPDIRIKRAIIIYCLEPIGESGNAPDWATVAEILGDGSTENSIKKAVSEFLKKI